LIVLILTKLKIYFWLKNTSIKCSYYRWMIMCKSKIYFCKTFMINLVSRTSKLIWLWQQSLPWFNLIRHTISFHKTRSFHEMIHVNSLSKLSFSTFIYSIKTLYMIHSVSLAFVSHKSKLLLLCGCLELESILPRTMICLKKKQ